VGALDVCVCERERVSDEEGGLLSSVVSAPGVHECVRETER